MWWSSTARSEPQGLSDEWLALHWQPEAAADARWLTLAAALMLERDRDGGLITADHLARRIESERAALRQWFEWMPLAASADGLYAVLVNRLAWQAEGLQEAVPGAIEEHLILQQLIDLEGAAVAPVLAVQWQVDAGRRAPAVWRRLAARLEGDADQAIEILWQSRFDPQSGDLQPRMLELARQAQRLDAAPDEHYTTALAQFRLLEAELYFAHNRRLSGLWSLLQLLVDLSADRPGEMPDLGESIERLVEQHRDALAAVDPVLLASMAQLGDAYALLASGAALNAVTRPLADVYSQLALFIPDASFYLGQPVRSSIGESRRLCQEATGGGEVLERQAFDACLTALFGVVVHDVRTTDLAGDSRGPFAPDALRRELGLMSWQRIRYLLGYLNWVLGSNCPAPDLFNVPETALGVEQISYWTSMRKVYFSSQRWRDAAAELHRDVLDTAAEIHRWADCMAGSGGIRRDPIERLIAAYRIELMQLGNALADARTQFREQTLSPDADIRFSAGVEQLTNWRPEGLRVLPCDPDQTCGVSLALPVSRALLGMFPQTYLLAAQSGMGEITICYDRVRWVERRQSPTRRDDERVANYHGRLSFELAGRFQSPDGVRDVFRHRLTTPDEYHYLFAAADDEVLELECPRPLIGQPIESFVSTVAVKLVPDRLTYFATAPTTPANLIAGNWDRGGEWRDWLLTGQHVEALVADDGTGMLPELQAQLRRLAEEQDRMVVARLMRQPGPGETDPLTLSMARLSDLKALMRRALELIHPALLRHHDEMRSAFTGEFALLDREQVRRLRGQGIPIDDLPQVAQARVDTLRTHWLAFPESYRHTGQPSPELIHALLRLAELED